MLTIFYLGDKIGGYMKTLNDLFKFALSKADRSNKRDIESLRIAVEEANLLEVDFEDTAITYWTVSDTSDCFESNHQDMAKKLTRDDYMEVVFRAIQDADWSQVNEGIEDALIDRFFSKVEVEKR
jgi:hypothetical protein